MTRKIELLAPAKDAATAIAAIRCGADAVYMGAEKFGAREAAANTTEAIKQVTDLAHQYYAKVYVTLNTLLYDEELPAAEKMIGQLYKIGIDGLIIQDAGLLELDLPPLPMIASTQMNNDSPEKVRFLQDVGFSRAILARELTLDEIKRIRKATSIELECFIHGALCVGMSGQCYMSYALGGRSGNRGQCAQPCRRIYSVKDEQGKIIVRNRHLLSLKDLNLAEHLEELIDAGVSSFKIEGRLKDVSYVVNTVGYYRKLLDKIMTKKNLQKSSSGTVQLSFEPNLEKTFNRGFTDYGFRGKAADFGSIDTPKSMGEFVGVVTDVGKDYFVIDGEQELHNADGICFFDNEKNLSGTVINGVEGRKVYPQKMFGIHAGQKIYRNYDCQFVRKLTGKASQRKIGLSMVMRETPKGFALVGSDEDGNEATAEIVDDKQPALKKESARQTTVTQLTKLGNTIFECSDVQMETQDVYFLPVSRLNAAKRELVARLLEVRECNRPRASGNILKNDIEYPEKQLTYMGNVLNTKAEAFYRRHGVETIEPAAESGLDLSGRVVMTTKYCLRQELGLCGGSRSKTREEPLILQDEDGREYKIKFCCGPCGMQICFGR
jgi:putative protease